MAEQLNTGNLLNLGGIGGEGNSKKCNPCRCREPENKTPKVGVQK